MKKYLPKTIKNPQGFTLIELLIAVSILAVLGVIGLTVFNSAQRNSRDARRKADIDTISKALENDFISNSRTGYQVQSGSMFAGGVAPQDPTNADTYIYTTTVAGTPAKYTTCAKLEAGSGGNSSDNSGTAAANGGFYCLKSQQ